jgi:hypothetical protein
MSSEYLNEFEQSSGVLGGRCDCGGVGCAGCGNSDIGSQQGEISRRRLAARPVLNRGGTPRRRRQIRQVSGRPVPVLSIPVLGASSLPYTPLASTVDHNAGVPNTTAAIVPHGSIIGKANDLIPIEAGGGTTVHLRRDVAAMYSRMLAAARSEGITAPLLTLRNNSRTLGLQRRSWSAALATYGGPQEASLWCAPPGTAASRDGRVMELFLGANTGGAVPGSSRDSPAYVWLAENAGRFGFRPVGKMATRWMFAGLGSGSAMQGEVPPAAAGAAAAGAALSIAQLGVGVAQLGVSISTMVGGHSLNVTNGAAYVHPNTPVYLPMYRVTYHFPVRVHYGLDLASKTFNYEISFEYNGYDIRNVTISDFGDNDLFTGKMNIVMSVSPLALPNDVRYSMIVNISGKWDPLGFGEYNFSKGQLFIDSQGKCSIYQ